MKMENFAMNNTHDTNSKTRSGTKEKIGGKWNMFCYEKEENWSVWPTSQLSPKNPYQRLINPKLRRGGRALTEVISPLGDMTLSSVSHLSSHGRSRSPRLTAKDRFSCLLSRFEMQRSFILTEAQLETDAQWDWKRPRIWWENISTHDASLNSAGIRC